MDGNPPIWSDEEREVINQMNHDIKVEKEKLRKEGKIIEQTEDEAFLELLEKKSKDKEYMKKLDKKWEKLNKTDEEDKEKSQDKKESSFDSDNEQWPSDGTKHMRIE